MLLCFVAAYVNKPVETADYHDKGEKENEDPSLDVSYDAEWFTRGTGRSYNSMAGHGSLMGKNTGKIIFYSVKSKQCRKCDFAIRYNKTPTNHNCSKNWTASSTAMESGMAVEMLSELRQKGTNVTTLIMDNDSTTISRAREALGEDLRKESDRHHTKKA